MTDGRRPPSLSPFRNTVPQSPSFPPSQRPRLISDVSELFRLNFPYTTVYPALGNLDLLENRERRARLEHGGVARMSSVTSKGRKQRRRDGRRRRGRRKEKEIEGGGGGGESCERIKSRLLSLPPMFELHGGDMKLAETPGLKNAQSSVAHVCLPKGGQFIHVGRGNFWPLPDFLRSPRLLTKRKSADAEKWRERDRRCICDAKSQNPIASQALSPPTFSLTLL